MFISNIEKNAIKHWCMLQRCMCVTCIVLEALISLGWNMIIIISPRYQISPIQYCFHLILGHSLDASDRKQQGNWQQTPEKFISFHMANMWLTRNLSLKQKNVCGYFICADISDFSYWNDNNKYFNNMYIIVILSNQNIKCL